MGTILEVPIIRTIIFWGLYWGPLNPKPNMFSRGEGTVFQIFGLGHVNVKTLMGLGFRGCQSYGPFFGIPIIIRHLIFRVPKKGS